MNDYQVIDATIARMRELREALEGLVDRLDEVHADPAYRSVWTVNQLHAGPYAGLDISRALARARAALEDPR